MFNQPLVMPCDFRAWYNHRNMMLNRMYVWCKKNNIFFTSNSDDINLSHGINKIVYMRLFDLLPPIEYWHTKNQQLQKLGATMFVLTDNFIELEDLEYVKFYSAPTLHSIFCSYQDTLPPNHNNPGKLFNCFIQRVDSVRQSWFYQLYLKRLLERGYVSFLLFQLTEYSALTGVELFDYIHYTNQLDKIPQFHEAYIELRSQVPYRNFVETLDLTPMIQNSKYSLVLETFATNPSTDRWLITEKTIRVLCFPSIPLLFLQNRAVEKLKSIGFQVDHHDDIDMVPWQQKQQMLLDIIEQDSIDFNKVTLYNTSMHNRNVCAKLQQQCYHNNYFDKFFTQVLEH